MSKQSECIHEEEFYEKEYKGMTTYKCKKCGCLIFKYASSFANWKEGEIINTTKDELIEDALSISRLTKGVESGSELNRTATGILALQNKSKAQRGKFHAMEERGEISHKVVEEWDKASKGKKLPKKVKKRRK